MGRSGKRHRAGYGAAAPAPAQSRHAGDARPPQSPQCRYELVERRGWHGRAETALKLVIERQPSLGAQGSPAWRQFQQPRRPTASAAATAIAIGLDAADYLRGGFPADREFGCDVLYPAWAKPAMADIAWK